MGFHLHLSAHILSKKNVPLTENVNRPKKMEIWVWVLLHFPPFMNLFVENNILVYDVSASFVGQAHIYTSVSWTASGDAEYICYSGKKFRMFTVCQFIDINDLWMVIVKNMHKEIVQGKMYCKNGLAKSWFLA